MTCKAKILRAKARTTIIYKLSAYTEVKSYIYDPTPYYHVIKLIKQVKIYLTN